MTDPPRHCMPRHCMPRHCMVVYAYYPHTETRVQRQAEALVRAGFDVDVVCLRDRGEAPRARYRGVHVHRLPVSVEKRSLARQFGSYLHFLVRAGAHLARLQRAHPYHSVQVHNLPDFLVFSALVPKLAGVPVVLDLHDLMPEFFAGRFGGAQDLTPSRRLVASAIAWQERMSCRFADHVVTVSDHWRDALIARGVTPSRCSVVMNVADEEIFGRARPSAVGPRRFELVYHGTVTYRYGLDLALEAVAKLATEIPEIHLTILGRGDLMAELFARRAQLGIEHFVDLRDEYVVAEELPAALGGADVGIVPYRDDVFTDGLLPTKLMEYAVMGLPCVAARTQAISSYFAGTMVEFFQPGDADSLANAIRRLYDDREHRRALARGARRFTERYSWERLGAEYVELITRLRRSG